jgi:hypothetical protein
VIDSAGPAARASDPGDTDAVFRIFEMLRSHALAHRPHHQGLDRRQPCHALRLNLLARAGTTLREFGIRFTLRTMTP